MGGSGRRVLLVAEGEVPAAAGRPFESLRVIGIANRPYDGVRGSRGCDGGWWWWRPTRTRSPFDFPQGERAPPPCGALGKSRERQGLVVGSPRSAPLWMPASAGTTMGGVRAGECCGWRRLRFPPPRERRNLRAIRRETEAPPSLAPALGSRFRGKDDGGAASFVCPQDRLRRGSGRTD